MKGCRLLNWWSLVYDEIIVTNLFMEKFIKIDQYI
jgi:hypothetical protein